LLRWHNKAVQIEKDHRIAQRWSESSEDYILHRQALIDSQQEECLKKMLLLAQERTFLLALIKKYSGKKYCV